MKKNKGITLIALVVTVIILLIIATVAIYSGAGTVNYAKYNKAKHEMEIMQSNVNSWYDEYAKADDKQAVLNKYGTAVPVNDKTTKTINAVNAKRTSTTIDISKYKFLSEEYIKSNLGLEDSFEFLINIQDRDVILYEGLTYNKKTYYTPEDFDITNVKGSFYANSVEFTLSQGLNTEIVISDLTFRDNQGNPMNISKFKVLYQVKNSGNWSDITSKITKYEEDNKIKYKFDAQNLGTYNVKISTTDNAISNIGEQEIKELKAVFKAGNEVNIKMKQFAGAANATTNTSNTNITAVKRATEIASEYKNNNYIVSTQQSDRPIYMWFDNGTIWYYTEVANPKLNGQSLQFFSKLDNLSTIDVDTWDTSDVTTMLGMFNECSSLKKLNLYNFNTSKVTNMQNMFFNCKNLTDIDLSGFNTSKVTSMYQMFYGCEKLTDLNLRNFDTTNVTSMSGMFGSCTGLTNLNISTFDTAKVTRMDNMFNNCKSLTSLDIHTFNTRNM